MGLQGRGERQIPNEFLTFRDSRTEVRHPIRLYSRYINKARPCPLGPPPLALPASRQMCPLVAIAASYTKKSAAARSCLLASWMLSSPPVSGDPVGLHRPALSSR